MCTQALGNVSWEVNKKRSLLQTSFFCSGKTGIRTPDTLWRYTRFPGVPLKPLEHLSLLTA